MEGMKIGDPCLLRKKIIKHSQRIADDCSLFSLFWLFALFFFILFLFIHFYCPFQISLIFRIKKKIQQTTGSEELCFMLLTFIALQLSKFSWSSTFTWKAKMAKSVSWSLSVLFIYYLRENSNYISYCKAITRRLLMRNEKNNRNT